MQPALLDTSIYISALRRGAEAALALRRLAADSPLWLSAGVPEELYAGAGNRDRRVIDRLDRDFDRMQRILVPSQGDWKETGKGLARLADRYGCEQIGQGRLTNDALIAMSARRLGIRVITGNQRDYSRLAEFRRFHWDIAVI